MPSFKREKFLVPKFWIKFSTPRWPPELPFSRKRILPNFKSKSSDYEKFESLLDVDGFSFPMNVYEVIRNQTLYSGNGVFSNVKISNKNMVKFLKNNEKLFEENVKTHLKLINNFYQTPK